MALLGVIRRYMWLAAVLFGLVFIGAGAYMISEGLGARDDVRDTLIAEKIVTTEDASIPNATVDGPATALAQANIIREHTLENTDGKTYSEMDREDPNRALYLNSVTLRTALTQAYMGFKVADLVIGVGAVVLVVGLSSVLLTAPALYWTCECAPQRAPATARKPLTPTAHEPAPSG